MPWAPDYVSAADLKDYLRIASADTIDDVQLALNATAASRAVDGATHRQFGQVTAPEQRLYTPRWDSSRCRWVVVIDDLMDSAGFTLTVANGAVTQYTLESVNAAQRGRPWTRVVISDQSTVLPKGQTSEAVVVGKWGWAAIPAPIKNAALLQGARLSKRRDAPFGVAGSPESGSEVRLLAKLDPDLEVVLSMGGFVRRKLATG